MDQKINKGVLLIIFLVCVLSLIQNIEAKFVRSYLTVYIDINDDGSANVREELRFFMDSSYSIDLYQTSLRVTNDIAGWRQRTELNDIQYHIETSVAPVTNIHLQPLQPDTCDKIKNTCYGIFIIEYLAKAPEDEKGVVNIKKYIKPRVTTYSLKKNALSFELSLFNEPYLPEYTTLEIRLPEDSSIISVKPRPAEYEEYEYGIIPKGAKKFTFNGRLSLANLELVFERKESLLSEVKDFFTMAQEMVTGWAISEEGITLTIAAFILIAGYVALKLTE